MLSHSDIWYSCILLCFCQCVLMCGTAVDLSVVVADTGMNVIDGGLVGGMPRSHFVPGSEPNACRLPMGHRAFR